MFGRWLVLWHDDSPGVRVTVYRWFPWFRRSPFATCGEILRAYDRFWAEDWTR